MIHERHRHRYEFNNDYREVLTRAGMVIGGTSPDGHIVETVELPDQDFFVGVQFHPEFKSRPNKAHPLFRGLVQASLNRQEKEAGALLCLKGKTDMLFPYNLLESVGRP